MDVITWTVLQIATKQKPHVVLPLPVTRVVMGKKQTV